MYTQLPIDQCSEKKHQVRYLAEKTYPVARICGKFNEIK